MTHVASAAPRYPADPRHFSPALLRMQASPPSPLPRAVVWALACLVAAVAAWTVAGRLDVIAVAQGRLVPQGFVKIVQPAEAGIVREFLVREGDAVEAGQVVVRMDTRLAEVDVAALRSQIAMRRLQLRRVAAELTGIALRRAAGDPPELYAQTEAQHRARQQAHRDAVAAEQAALDKARSELRSARELEAKLARALPIYREQADSWEQLAREGFAGKLLALDQRRRYVETEQEWKAQAARAQGAADAIVEAERRLAGLQSTYRRQLEEERIAAGAELERLTQELERHTVRQGLLEVRAPAAGIVKELATHTPGAVVQPGTILMTVVPSGEAVQAEVWIDQVDSGFVQPGQVVRVKVATYPFQRYGMASGRVAVVSPDASDRAFSNDSGTAGHGAVGNSSFRALVSLDTPYLERDGVRLHLNPGMQVAAEIHLGERRVIDYLLSPVRKTLHEAGRER
jgi:HlyD family secretion protein